MTEVSIAIEAAAPATTHEPSGPRPGALAGIAIFAVLVVLAGVVLVPILATALNGFKELGDLESRPFSLPRVWVWKNYWDILTGFRYWQVLGNSLVISVLTTFLTLALSSMAAFTFAHLRFFGDRFLLSYIQLGLMFPLATAIPAIFIRVRDLGLLDSYWGVVLPQVAFSLAMAVLLLRNAFKQLPGELLDAALMDGCGYFRYFFYVTLPLSGPILSTVAVISFVDAWNSFLLPLIIFNSESRYPWTLGLEPYYLLADKTWAFSAILIVILWKYFGFYTMLYVAGLQGIDRSLLEAAEMDGASAFQRFWHITLPLLGPMIRLSIFFAVIGSLKLFDFIVPLTGGGPFETTNTMVSYLYYFGITRMRFGYSSAVGIVLFVICVAFAFGYRRIVMRDD